MRYLDAIEIESPNHTLMHCMTPNCERLIPYNEAWQIATSYRHLDNYWRHETVTALCCSRECCERIARLFIGEGENPTDIMKTLDHDELSARMLAELQALMNKHEGA